MNGQVLLPSDGTTGQAPEASVLLGRLLVALLLGLLGVGVCRTTFLQPGESAALALFLKGQGAATGEGVSLLGKLFASFALCATAGWYFSFEIPVAHLRKARKFTFGAFLFIFTTAAYIPVMTGDFIWDDDSEVTANATLVKGSGLWEIWTGGITSHVSPSGEGESSGVANALRNRLQKMEKRFFGEDFVSHASPDYFPLKSTFLWLEYRFFGTDATGYHVTNIVVHALNTVLLWRLFRQLKIPGAWLGALFFGIHPVHAESVAWISEAKNTYSLLFLIPAAGAWLRFRDEWLDGRFARGQYLLALGCYAASLLCKTSGIMFPFVLFLLTWWRQEGVGNFRQVGRSLIVQTAPFFAISLVLGLVTIWFQNTRAIGAEVIPIGDFWSRLAGAGLAFWWYLGKALLPIQLTTIYPRWAIDPAQGYQLAVAASVPLVAAVLWWAQRWLGRTPLMVYGFFFLMLLPVLGFFKMSYMRLTLVADHFQYLSNIAVVALAGALLARALQVVPKGAAERVLKGALILVLAWLGGATWGRAAVHFNEETLWTDALKHNWHSWQSHNHLGVVFYSKYLKTPDGSDHLDRAHSHFSKAVELNPRNPEVQNNYALSLQLRGEMQAALEAFRRGMEADESLLIIRRNYAEALVRLERYVDALEQYRILVERGFGSEQVMMGFGKVLFETGRLKGAHIVFSQVLEGNPANSGAAGNLRAVEARIEELRRAGKYRE